MSTTTHDPDDIPLDIQREIIKRIQDVKSLIRYRLVSKAWKSLIDSSKFIAHYKSNNHRILVSIVRQYYRRSIVGHIYDRASIVDDNDDDSFPLHHLPLPLALPKKEPQLIGTSHGLFCFYGREEGVAVVWNPSIRKSVTIHVPDMHINFGVCPRSMDLKLVNIRTADKLADIYTLSSSSSTGFWTSLSINLPNNISKNTWFYYNDQYHRKAAIDGILYWQAYDSDCMKHQIITFDLSSEKFGEVCLPDSLARLSMHMLYISSKINDQSSSLVVIEYNTSSLYHRDRKGISHVWMMEEHGLFKKVFTIEAPFFNIVKGLRMNGQAIIEKDSMKTENKLQFYDPCNGQISDHELRRIGRGGGNVLVMGCYIETLLLLNHRSD